MVVRVGVVTVAILAAGVLDVGECRQADELDRSPRKPGLVLRWHRANLGHELHRQRGVLLTGCLVGVEDDRLPDRQPRLLVELLRTGPILTSRRLEIRDRLHQPLDERAHREHVRMVERNSPLNRHDRSFRSVVDDPDVPRLHPRLVTAPPQPCG